MPEPDPGQAAGNSVAEVAEALGVSKPFLYYYLKNKDDILFECSRIATEQLHAMLDEVLAQNR